MADETPSPPDDQFRLPDWLRIAVWVILLSTLTQVTLQHLAMRIAGLRTGEVASLSATEDGQAILHDPFAVYPPDSLAGDGLWIGGQRFEVTGNTATELRLAAPASELEPLLDGKSSYLTGTPRQGALVKLALAVPGLNFTLSDVLLGLGCLLLAAWLAKQRRWPRRWLPPWTLLAFLAICLVSLRIWARGDPGAPNLGSGLKELVQYAEVLVIGFVFFLVVWQDARLRRQAIWVLGAGAGLLIVIGFVEYLAIMRGTTLRGLADLGELDSLLGFRYNPERSGAAGSEAGKNMLAAYLLVLLPVLVALGFSPLRRPWRIAAFVAAGLGLVLIIHPLHLLIALTAVTVVAATLCPRRWIVPAVLGGGALVIVVTCAVNQHHGRALLDSVAMHRYADPYGLLPMPLKGQNQNTAPRWMLWQQKYAEVQAAFNAVGMAPLLGHGIGNYQERINAYYTNGPMWSLAVPKESGNFMERDAHGQFIVTAVETGILGLGALLIFLAVLLQNTFWTRTDHPDPWDRLWLAATAGILVALLLGGWLLPFLVRGLHILLIALLALPVAMSRATAARDCTHAVEHATSPTDD